MRPIPKRLLIHNAMLLTPTASDNWQNVVYDDPGVALDRIRIDADRSVMLTKDNTEAPLTCVLIYDCRNSSPPGLTFSPGQVVTWQDRRMTVMEASPMYDGRRLHHWEVSLQ